jgi:hypothetical protein
LRHPPKALFRQQIVGFVGTSKTAHRIRERIEGAGELGRAAGKFSREMFAIPGFGLVDRRAVDHRRGDLLGQARVLKPGQIER